MNLQLGFHHGYSGQGKLCWDRLQLFHCSECALDGASPHPFVVHIQSWNPTWNVMSYSLLFFKIIWKAERERLTSHALVSSPNQNNIWSKGQLKLGTENVQAVCTQSIWDSSVLWYGILELQGQQWLIPIHHNTIPNLS